MVIESQRPATGFSSQIERLRRWRAPRIPKARRRRRWGRRWYVLTVLLLTLAILAAIGWYEAMPRYRPTLQAEEKYGIDVSNHQGDIDWARVAKNDVSLAYIKATEGNDFVDKRFADNWSGAESAGIRRGAYHFFTLCSSGEAQAANFLQALPDDPQALPPAVDLEFSACERRPRNTDFQRELRTFVDTVERQVGKPVVIYALPSFEKRYPVTKSMPRDRWNRRLFRRPAPEASPKWAVWQASNRARVDGIEGPVDFNVWRPAAMR